MIRASVVPADLRESVEADEDLSRPEIEDDIPRVKNPGVDRSRDGRVYSDGSVDDQSCREKDECDKRTQPRHFAAQERKKKEADSNKGSDAREGDGPVASLGSRDLLFDQTVVSQGEDEQEKLGSSPPNPSKEGTIQEIEKLIRAGHGAFCLVVSERAVAG